MKSIIQNLQYRGIYENKNVLKITNLSQTQKIEKKIETKARNNITKLRMENRNFKNRKTVYKINQTQLFGKIEIFIKLCLKYKTFMPANLINQMKNNQFLERHKSSNLHKNKHLE